MVAGGAVMEGVAVPLRGPEAALRRSDLADPAGLGGGTSDGGTFYGHGGGAISFM